MPLTYDTKKIPRSIAWDFLADTKNLSPEATDVMVGEYVDKGRTVMVEDDKLWGLNSITFTLIMSTMFVGMGKITEENHVEFYTRLALWQFLSGPLMQKAARYTGADGTHCVQYDDYLITYEDVYAHIGLECNVTHERMGKWMSAKRLGDMLAVMGEKERAFYHRAAQVELEEAMDNGEG